MNEDMMKEHCGREAKLSVSALIAGDGCSGAGGQIERKQAVGVVEQQKIKESEGPPVHRWL